MQISPLWYAESYLFSLGTPSGDILNSPAAQAALSSPKCHLKNEMQKTGPFLEQSLYVLKYTKVNMTRVL
jgi:hypothetical protein